MKKFLFFLMGTILLLGGCITQKGEKEVLTLATTTSTYDSGLLDYLLPDFEENYNAEVRIISVGTGQAIETGKRGDADVILVHSPKDEIKFVEEGFGVNRQCVMYNDFVVVGPERDPAKIKGLGVLDAFRKISATKSVFVSRGDDSGTHKKEKRIWERTGVAPMGNWYLEIGSGMGDTLRFASEKLAYTLTDRGTYLSLKDSLELVVLVEGDELLLNPYGVIVVNPELHPNINYTLAMKFVEWLLSEKTQKRIESFEKNGEQLFFPLYGKCIGGVA